MKTYKNWDEAFLQDRLTEIESEQEADDRMERFVNRSIICVVAALVIGFSAVAWLIYRGFTT